MKTGNLKHLLLFIPVLFSFHLLASGPADDLKKMNAFYKSKKNIYLEFTMSLNYINYSEKMQKHTCLYTHSEKGSYSKVFDHTILNTTRYTLQMDAAGKTAVLSNYIKDGKEADIQDIFKEPGSAGGDSVNWEAYYTFSYKTNTPDTKVIVIQSKEKESWEYDHIEISLSKDFALKAITYFNKIAKDKNPQIASVSIIYTKSEYQVAHNEYFNMATYMEIKGSKLLATEKLKGYRIIDNRIKN